MVKPVRIQRKRTKGYNMQKHSKSINGLDAVYVGRPTVWGNPYIVGEKSPHPPFNKMDHGDVVECFAFDISLNIEHSNFDIDKWLAPLRGRNLARFCPSGKSCHADVLLELANNAPAHKRGSK